MGKRAARTRSRAGPKGPLTQFPSSSRSDSRIGAGFSKQENPVKTWTSATIALALVVALIVPTRGEARAASAFEPTIVNAAPTPGPAPKGMVWIPGGEFSMGAED